jgi:glycosyltransferase involved in cell wall biosynthesis
VNDRRFGLVVAHDSMALRAGWRVARRCRCPLLYDAVEIPDDRSGWSLQNMPAWVLRTEAFFDARIIRRCARIVTVSNGLADWMVRRYRIARPALIRNCRHYVEIRPDDRIRRDAGLGDGDRLALYLNSLYPGQGLEQLIDSIGYLPDNIHVATLGPVTKPDYADALLRQAREVGNARRFHVLPPKPPDEMLQYAAGADIGVVPRQNTSFNNYISLPNRIFELTMSRLPIAAPSLPDMKRFVEEYGVGISFDETDPRDIARVVAEMLEPGRLAGFRARMEEVARELCWEREGARFVAIASEAMA